MRQWCIPSLLPAASVKGWHSSQWGAAGKSLSATDPPCLHLSASPGTGWTTPLSVCSKQNVTTILIIQYHMLTTLSLCNGIVFITMRTIKMCVLPGHCHKLQQQCLQFVFQLSFKSNGFLWQLERVWYLCVICSPGKLWVVWFPRIFILIWLMHFLSWPGNEPKTRNKTIIDQILPRHLDQM